MRRLLLRSATGLAILGLAGCGLNAIRVETASQVNIASDAVVKQAKAALDDVAERRETAYVTLIASDPSCSLVDPVYIYVRVEAAAAPAPRCAASAVAARPGYRIVPVAFAPFSVKALKPTMTLIGAVADYGDALAKIVSEPKPDIGKDLEAIKSKVEEAGAIAHALTGVNMPGLPDLGSKQAKTAIAFANFIAALIQENEQVKDIRKVVRKHAGELPEIVRQLGEQVADWQNIIALGDAQSALNSLSIAYDADRATLDFDRRKAMVILYRQARRDADHIPIAAANFQAALGKFVEADKLLRDLLDGKVSPEMRRKANQITQERILTGLKLISDALIAWGV